MEILVNVVLAAITCALAWWATDTLCEAAREAYRRSSVRRRSRRARKSSMIKVRIR